LCHLSSVCSRVRSRWHFSEVSPDCESVSLGRESEVSFSTQHLFPTRRSRHRLSIRFCALLILTLSGICIYRAKLAQRKYRIRY
jgi:hypothetical protein